MSSKFVLRDEQTQENPYAARLYGLGITQGHLVIYDYNGTSTTLLAILAQGSRFRNDLPCSKAIRVLYSGFDLPEFDETGIKNWRFHQGKVTKPPVYVPVDSISTSTDQITRTGHGYVTGDLIAFHGRGTDVALPTTAATPMAYETAYMVNRIDANNYQVLNQITGTANPANKFDFTSTGANIARLFSYKADALYFDTEQGRPEFFPLINFTFAGLTYIEVRIPADLSNGEDEPTNLKVLMEGKLVYDVTLTGGVVTYTGTSTAQPNNALVAIDALNHDQGIPMTRFGSSFINWRDRCDQLITWAGGNDSPQEPNGFPVFGAVIFDVANNRLTKTGGTGGVTDWAITAAFDADNASCEFTYSGGWVYCAFTDSTSVTNHHGILIRQLSGHPNTLYYWNNATLLEITSASPSDKFKIAYENGLLVIYKNSIPMPSVENTYAQRWTTNYRIALGIDDVGIHMDQIYIAPSGTNSVPRQIPRFRGHYVASQPNYVSDLFETMIHLSPGTSWAEFDGKIEIATIPMRQPSFTFTTSNTSRIEVRRKSLRNTNNFWRYIYRDADNLYLQRDFVTIDRKLRRTANGGRLVDPGIQQYSVMTQSQMERIGETRARIESDLDVGFSIEAFLDSLAVCKGAFGYVVDPVSGYDALNPAKVMVIEDRLSLSDIEKKIYEVQIITDDFYSDTDHSPVTTQANTTSLPKFAPPPTVSSLVLTETTEPLPTNEIVSTLTGDIDFTPPSFAPMFASRARIYKKVFTDTAIPVSYNNGTNFFSVSDATLIPNGTTPISLVSTNETYPTNANVDTKYFVVGVSGTNFRLSLTIGGTALSFGSTGANLRLYGYKDWIDTLIDVTPASNNHGTFEMIPAQKSWTVIRAVTFSLGGTSLSFNSHKTAGIQITGSVAAPVAPARLTYAYDGARVDWGWSASPTVGVNGYKVTDENNVTQAFTSDLSYSEMARSDRVARRVYAVSSTGVLSASFAEFTFIKPPVAANFINVTGITIDRDNSLHKTASTGWDNAGAILNSSVLSDRVAGYISGAPDQLTEMMFGFTTTPNVDGQTDFRYGLHFKADGTVWIYDNDPIAGLTHLQVSTYVVGDRFYIKIIPDLTAGEQATFEIIKSAFHGKGVDEQITSFSEAAIRLPFYAGIALYTNNVTTNPSIQLSGLLTPAVGVTPTQVTNLTNATYSAGTATSTGGSGDGSSGLSFQYNSIAGGTDGGYTFKATGYVAAGIAISDDDRTFADTALRIEIYDDFSTKIYQGGTLIRSDLIVGGSDEIFIGRENGEYTIRKNGHLEYVNATSIGINASDGFLFDIAFRHDIAVSSVTQIKQHQGLAGDFYPVNVDTKGFALVGDNTIDQIPSFDISTPKAGDQLVYDATATEVVTKTGSKTLQKFFADASCGTSEIDLYSFPIPAGALSDNGDQIRFEYFGVLAANAEDKGFVVKFGGTTIFSDTVSEASQAWMLSGEIVRETAAIVRCITRLDLPTYRGSNYIRVTGLTLANENILVLRSGSDSVADVIAKAGAIELIKIP